MSTSFLGLDKILGSSASPTKLLGDLTGANQAAKGAQAAADAQVKASEDANALQKYMYDTNRADLADYRTAGNASINKLMGLTGLNGNGFNMQDFQSSPQYQFGLNQGLKGIQRQLAASGLSGSGAGLKAANNYAQNYAGQQFGDYYNRLAGLAGIGQQATNQTGAYGSNYANQAGQNMLEAGNARGSAYITKGNVPSLNFNNLLQIGKTAASMYGGGGFGGGIPTAGAGYGNFGNFS